MSNGNQPLKVAKHLTKLFDSMAKLKLREGPQCNNAYAMIAKDGEHVSKNIADLVLDNLSREELVKCQPYFTLGGSKVFFVL